MNLTEHPPPESTLLATALAGRDDAREGFELLAGLADASAGSPVHAESVDLRDAARARLAACEAWLGWLQART
jgi:hypothetical protein